MSIKIENKALNQLISIVIDTNMLTKTIIDHILELTNLTSNFIAN